MSRKSHIFNSIRTIPLTVTLTQAQFKIDKMIEKKTCFVVETERNLVRTSFRHSTKTQLKGKMNPFPAMLNCQLLLFLYFIAARFIKLYIVYRFYWRTKNRSKRARCARHDHTVESKPIICSFRLCSVFSFCFVYSTCRQKNVQRWRGNKKRIQ